MKKNKALLFSLISLVLACIAVVFSVLIYTGSGGSKAASEYDPASYAYMEKCVAQIRKTTDFKPEIALVLGSGLGDISDSIDVKGEISYKDIEGFPVSTAPGHDGKFVFGTIGDKKVICMDGRVHMYEGYSAAQVVLPIRIMHLLGAETLVLTNAAGGINADYKVGDFMLITDHISSFVPNPLIGKNEDELGTRFPAMSEAYDPDLCSMIRGTAKELGISLKEGVYTQLTGPSYESSAELKMLRQIGTDAVGMSTVVEAIAARHSGMRVCAVSNITNIAYDISSHVADEKEVIAEG